MTVCKPMRLSTAAEPPTINLANTAWMLTSSVLVLFMMIPGLALFYGAAASCAPRTCCRC